MSPAYCSIFAEHYTHKYIDYIVDKPEYTAKDVDFLNLISVIPREVYKHCADYFYPKFKEINKKIWFCQQSIGENERQPDIIFLYSNHLRLALDKYSILYNFGSLQELISNLSSFELRKLDEFVLSYAYARGLYHKDRYLGVRSTGAYYSWNKQVMMRDAFTCQRCGVRKDLVAHHIKPVSDAPEFATDINNGITLCKKCHNDYHRGRGISNCRAEDLYQFIQFYKRATQ